MFGMKNKRQSSEPTETAAVTKNVVAALWGSQDAQGRPSFRWSLSRIDNDGTTIRRTFKVEHVLQIPEAVRVLAKSFAQIDTLDEAQRTELSRLATLMEKAIEQLRPNGLAAEGKSTTSLRVLS
jgi:hypothetical protein